MTKSVKLSDIRIDGGTQARASLDEATVGDYADAITEGAQFPPVVVFFDGSAYWLADGFHRFHAHRKAGSAEIGADIRQGTKRDAILHSLGANSDHGLRRSNADKRKAVETMLADAEWSAWSDREIARQCSVSHVFVGKLRPVTGNVTSEDRTYKTKHGTAATMDTSKIGKADAPVDGDVQKEGTASETLAPQGVEGDDERKAGQKGIAPVGGLTDADRIAELEEANRFLEKELARLEAKLKTFERLDLMYRDWTEGGWEQVVQAKEDTIAELQRTALTRIARESGEKEKNLRDLRAMGRKLDEAGKGRDIYIDLDEASHG